MQHSDFYDFGTHFWWLIFPIGWGFAGLVQLWSRHRVTQQALDVIKSYAEQNKEPPAEVVQILKARPARPPLERSRRLMTAGLIFVALAIGFCVMVYGRMADGDPDASLGVLFITVLMAGIAAAFFISSYVAARDGKRSDPLERS